MPIPFLAYLAAHPAVGNLLTSGAAVFINGTNAFLGNQSREDAMRLNFQNSERQRAHQESTNKMQQEHQLR